MMPLRIPTTNDPYSVQRTELDGSEYILRMYYSAREDRWSFSLATDSDVALVSGVRIVPEIPLLRRYHCYDGTPPGEIVCISYNGDSPPGLDDLVDGGRCELLYYPAAELAGLLV